MKKGKMQKKKKRKADWQLNMEKPTYLVIQTGHQYQGNRVSKQTYL